MFRGYDAKFKFDLLFTNIDRDDNCIVLNTDLGSKTKVRVWVMQRCPAWTIKAACLLAALIWVTKHRTERMWLRSDMKQIYKSLGGTIVRFSPE